MKTIVTITDITRMAPPFVCVAGVTDDKRNIRIQFNKSRIDERWLCSNGVTTIRPFARVGFVVISPRSEPPHTEDWYVDKYLLEAQGRINPDQRINFLSGMRDPSLASIFGTEIYRDPGFYVLKNTGSRSLGTIHVDRLLEVAYQCYDNSGWDCRLRFQDDSGAIYLLKVKDLTFCTYLDYLREHENCSCEQINRRLTDDLGESECYLRIGLARGWAQYPDRCYLQVTGVFNSPDYLQGRWFADFATPAAYDPVKAAFALPLPQERRVKEAPMPAAHYSTAPTPPLAPNVLKEDPQPPAPLPMDSKISTNSTPNPAQSANQPEIAIKELPAASPVTPAAPTSAETEETAPRKPAGWLNKLKEAFRDLVS